MRKLFLEDDAETTKLGALIAPHLKTGDTVGLIGGLGAGKSHLCRAIIQAKQDCSHVAFDIPSPSFSLVQTYPIDGSEYWHADLYRLGDISEIVELGLEEAFGNAVCLVEWADLLGHATPSKILLITLQFAAGSDGREVEFEARGPGWDWLGDVFREMKEPNP